LLAVFITIVVVPYVELLTEQRSADVLSSGMVANL
jgi:hypothetical protein